MAVALVFLSLPAGSLARSKDKHDGLLLIVTPTAATPASAHPHVNVIVQFGTSADGAAADPASFSARLGRDDVTAAFTPIVRGGSTVGLRAALPPELLRFGRGRKNRLRVQVSAVSGNTSKNARRPRDKDRVRFRAETRPNQAPVAILFTSSRIVLPGNAVSFDAAESHDPDDDAVTHRWDLGDGTTSDAVAVTHAFADGDADVTVRLTVDDGQTTNVASALLRSCGRPDAALPGFLAVTADDAMEFGPVAAGTTAIRRFTVENTDAPETTVAACIGVASRSGAFRVEPEELTLAGGERREVTVTFAPAADGHADATLTVVGSARERPIVTFLAHGYGGRSASPSGPTLAPQPFFYLDAQTGQRILRVPPDGAETAVDAQVSTCRVPQLGLGEGDVCVAQRDCASNSGTCTGDEVAFEPIQMCGDGAGGLYLLSDEGTFTDPTFAENELSISVLGLDLAADGSTTGRRILDRVVMATTQMACDGFPAASGRVYLAEYEEKDRGLNCFRSEQENLVTLRKHEGTRQVLMRRIDAAANVTECGDGDIDPVLHVETPAAGAATFASFESSGLWRIRPSPLQFLSADDNFLNEDLFRLHPDGDVLYTTTTNGPTSSVINLYKINADQVGERPIPLDALTPCAVYQIPNNGYVADDGSEPLHGSGSVLGFDAVPVASGSRDATVLVSFVAHASTLHPQHLASELAVHGTVAFSSRAGAGGCQVLGLTNLRVLDLMTF